MRSTRIALAAAVLLTAACADKTPDADATASTDTSTAAPVAASPAATITVRAKNYTFDMPDTVEAGPLTISLVNEGPPPEVHHVNVIRLLAGYTSKDLMNELKTGKMPAWAKAMGGPNPSTLTAPSVATVDLAPGSYVVVCFVPGPDLVPHVMKGMIKDLVVKPSTGTAAAMPTADVTIKLADYNFDVQPALTAGHHTIRVENNAAQDHEVILVKLDAGKTPDDVVNAIETMKGPPPGQFIGGVSGLSNGAVNTFEVDLTPGDYALLCVVPDAKDGKPHAHHGMKQLVKVI